MAGIIVYEGESFENALRRFRKSVERAGILRDVARHRHYEKPSERRKRRLINAKKRMYRRMKQGQ
ncbi:30S ribosomal protein S21 [candidate division WOR-3 bacterium]|uniref:Small ribosomal subunit protein bS21 n=1 Tax=candidate division WOR-3 bacterium TaxID=2052148 RepID=A0A660SIY2_UNCW3|nr:MAG: 30S ribosomal protein S21 [candidate division WOR-3 bacterium]